MTTTKLIEYVNGNTAVSIYADGTKVREYSGLPHPKFPETIDLKITNRCFNGCPYCHERATPSGKHCDTEALYDKLNDLPQGVELAIGGGNPLEHPNLYDILCFSRDRSLIANITVNQHDPINKDIISLVRGIGVSLDGTCFPKKTSPNMVCHVIAGIVSFGFIKSLIENKYKVLILGYKRHGFGKDYYAAQEEKITQNIAELKMRIGEIAGEGIVSFDNLAIEQLNIKRLFTDGGWGSFYMGDDFTFSMYIDAVNQIYAPTSRSDERTSWAGLSITDYFCKPRHNHQRY